MLARAEKHKARVVSFSPVDARTLCEKHEFDAELAARLGELTLRLPTLREFAEDVPDLASLMLAQLVEARACPPRRLAIAALNALRHHAWPGNLAELESVIKDLALSALEEEIQLEDVERVLAGRAAAERAAGGRASTVPTARRARPSSASTSSTCSRASTAACRASPSARDSSARTSTAS